MKIYFIKIITLSLLAFILPMSGGLCFQDLVHPAIKINIAQAAENEAAANVTVGDSNSVDSDLIDMNMNVCREAQATNQNSNLSDGIFNKASNQINNDWKFEKSLPISSNNNSLLPCCAGGTHPNLISSSPSFEIHKFIPFIANSFEKSLLSIRETISYQAPITAPPELASLETTILRL